MVIELFYYETGVFRFYKLARVGTHLFGEAAHPNVGILYLPRRKLELSLI